MRPTLQPPLCVPTPTSNFGPIVGKRGSGLCLPRKLTEAEDLGKKVDPRKDQAAKDRLKKRIRKLEKASQELIPIEDFITPVRFLDKSR